jgi:hypothetical protein
MPDNALSACEKHLDAMRACKLHIYYTLAHSENTNIRKSLDKRIDYQNESFQVARSWDISTTHIRASVHLGI